MTSVKLLRDVIIRISSSVFIPLPPPPNKPPIPELLSIFSSDIIPCLSPRSCILAIISYCLGVINIKITAPIRQIIPIGMYIFQYLINNLNSSPICIFSSVIIFI